MRTRSRLTFYPWSRLTKVEAGPVLVRCRQKSPRTLTVPEYLPTGPDEVARSIDFPAQLIGPKIRRELDARTDRKPTEIPMAGVPTVLDRALRWRLVRAWIRAQFGLAAWLLPAVMGLNIAMQLAIGSFTGGVFFVALAMLGLPVWWLTGGRRISGIYPIGAAVTGSAGEWLEVQGPWGSVAWPPGWLKPIRMTKHTVTYEMVQAHPDGTLAESTGVDKRIIVIPRAFLDTPSPAVRAES
ncbi:hypothetical protein [Nocardioides panzhihuensis]|uniref:Uncharacterized protein n=1 Tax=Nocardioides panzhihuensis TaxID=860243 RepID=A0A7Z0DRZ0_9ACTN|nr:hypothetical protein [Nocardioides panzhihuensis]NYI80696.1 hypothetical protein [Nocardioides panzhihuensis]